MTLDGRPKYPSRRTYVVKVRGDAVPEALAGVVENVVTGQQRTFQSNEQLLDLLLADVQATISEGPR